MKYLICRPASEIVVLASARLTAFNWIVIGVLTVIIILTILSIIAVRRENTRNNGKRKL